MKPIDLRDATWQEVQTHLTEDLVRVHLAWMGHGPGTTREVAQRSGISLLTLRPRTTDLYKLGLVVLVDTEARNGVYAYRSREEAQISLAWTERADFRRADAEAGEPSEPIERVGFVTVEDAVASLTPSDRGALGARLMSQYGHLLKRREARPGEDQLTIFAT